MGVKKSGLFLLMLFFVSSSLHPSQHFLVSVHAAFNQEIRVRENVVNRRGGGGGGHAGGGGGHAGGGGGHIGRGGRSGSNGEAKGVAVAGVVPLYGAAAVNQQNHNDGKRPRHRGSNSCTANYVGLAHFVFPLFCLSLSFVF